MPKQLRPQLSEEERQALLEMRHPAQTPYLREGAAALLKLAEGHTASALADTGLLRPRSYETVAEWFHRFQVPGVEGGKIKAGRGRKPANCRTVVRPWADGKLAMQWHRSRPQARTATLIRDLIFKELQLVAIHKIHSKHTEFAVA